MRRSLRAFPGREIATTGDDFLANFDGPAGAVHCAVRIRHAVGAQVLEIRAGLHAGEIERRGDDGGGHGVRIAGRAIREARPGEVLVSGAVADLVVGSGIVFGDEAAAELEGVPGRWRMREVTDLPRGAWGA